MNERHLFRARHTSIDTETLGIDKSEAWVIGWYGGTRTSAEDMHVIYYKNYYKNRAHTLGIARIDPATLGQCTGLKDDNDVLIFEGDIVDTGPDKKNGQEACLQEVVWDDDLSAFTIYDMPVGEWMRHGDVTVVGNIHDDPELLKA